VSRGFEDNGRLDEKSFLFSLRLYLVLFSEGYSKVIGKAIIALIKLKEFLTFLNKHWFKQVTLICFHEAFISVFIGFTIYLSVRIRFVLGLGFRCFGCLLGMFMLGGMLSWGVI